MKSKKQLSKFGFLILAGLTSAHALDFEQQLLIENKGLDIVLSQDALPKSVNLASDSQQSSQKNSSSFSSAAEAGLDSLLGAPSADSIDSGLDDLLGNDSLSTDDALGDLLGDLDSNNSTEGLGGLDALLGEVEPTEDAAAPSGFDGLLADIGSPAEPDTSDPLSDLDTLLGGVEIEETKIEGLGDSETAAPEVKEEMPKKVAKKETSKPVKEKEKQAKNKPKALVTEIIIPLDRKLKTEANISFNDLVQKIATVGGWQLNLSEEFKSLSTKKIGLRFNNVPLSFLLKWVSSQTGLSYKLKKEKLSI